MRIVFMGTPLYAVQILDEILKHFDVVGVFTQNDKKVGRKQILTPPDVKKFVMDKSLNIPIFQPISLKNDKICEIIKGLKPDFIVVAAYGKILPKSILDIAFCINLHASILPKYRGASPIQMQILNNEKMIGVSAMKMGEGLDDGEILGFSFIENQNFSSKKSFEILGNLASKLIIKTLNNINKILPLKQQEILSSKCKKITKTDGLIKFSDKKDEILSKFKAYDIWPGIFLENGTKLLEIFDFYDENCVFEDKKESFGKITKIEKDFFVILVKNGQIAIKILQESGKNPVAAKDFINGKRLKIGDKIY